MLDFTGRRVLIVGDVMLDVYCEGSVARVSPEAPVPVVLMSAQRHVPGGAANVAANVASLGADAHLVGVVGEDDNARLLHRIMGGRFPAVALGDIVVAPQRPTTTKTRIIGNNAQVVRLDHEHAAPLDAETERQLLDRVEAALPHCDVVVLSDYAKGVCTDAVIRGVIARATKARKPLLVDPKRRDFSVYAGATIIKPNLKELEAATHPIEADDEAVERAARSAAILTGASIIVTRSERGMSFIEAEGPAIHIPTAARTVFDVSGAGDTVMAALAVALNPDAPAEGAAHALAIANAAAGIVVAKAGTATVSTAEIAAEMARPSQLAGRSSAKIATRAQARAIAAGWRAQGLVVGFTNGCFDLLHPGHIQLLERSAEACDRLIVGLNTDASVSRLKGPTRPVQNETARAQVMAALGMVDLVVLFEEDTPAEIVAELLPQALMKGADYTVETVVGADTVIAHGGRVVLIDLVPDNSTTALVKRAMNGAAPQ
ncbi:MAG TPA: D-glycero-beta-D-manno-heptose-7-phosphate kinase [Bosea sp. (in: a-proteobacteria)]|jgi:D-beta-D-heptose 7-phosphate kinase/D-beta-D-heptose 1-phosphate adenosyltransferase|uniref:D-glycero-beta-D-manno-heptose-7-phosphate kinase n=1 Tax=Bosea sp. (in: a-proteobacteria) TaxID=1871050 RepID=UPI002E0E6F44|nr:D-glycero-beta-D-manno-heptose-7-phosphate kinase [Bosea sp. (in: a-proteobacteria)]